MLNFQDLPDELVLNILSYLETTDLFSCGQISKKIRRISHDGTLWATANLEKKIVKSEFLELILSKGCKILRISNSTILGHLSSNIKSQLSVLNFSHPGWKRSERDSIWVCDEYTGVLGELLSSCCLLQHLVLEGVFLTPEMAVGICKNGKTLQTLNLNSSYLDDLSDDNLDGTLANCYLQEIIKCCQELKEVDLAYVNDFLGLGNNFFKFLAKNISPNVEKLNLSSTYVEDEPVKILLRRCNKIKALTLEPYRITDDSLTNIRECLNLTLEELSFGTAGFVYSRTLRNTNNGPISFTGFLELKPMPRLKILNLYYQKDDGKEIQNLRQHLPHLTIKGHFDC